MGRRKVGRGMGRRVAGRGDGRKEGGVRGWEEGGLSSGDEWKEGWVGG